MQGKAYLGLFAALLTSTALSETSPAYPAAAPQAVTNTYHGVTVSDSYQWLENAANPEVQSWLKAENAVSRQWLDAIPGRDGIHARLKSLLMSSSSRYNHLKARPGKLFAIKSQPPKQQALLTVMGSPDQPAAEKVVLDPNLLAADGSISIDFYEPSPDGRLVALSLSKNGSEDGTMHIIETATGKEIDVAIPRVQYPTGGGSVSWAADGKGYYYTRYPAPGERAEADIHFYQQVYFHRLQQAYSQDQRVLGGDFPRIAETELFSAKSGEQVALVRNGDGGEVAVYLQSKGTWQRLADFADGVKDAEFGDDGWLYLLSRKDAPRGKLLRVALKHPQLASAQTVLGEGEGTIQHFALHAGKLYVASLLGGPTRLTVTDLRSLTSKELALPPISTVRNLVKLGAGDLLAEIESYTAAPAWYRIAADGKMQKTALYMSSAVNYDDTEVEREFAVSKDGTRVPLNIIHRKGIKLDGNNPTLLYAYGGYGVSEKPAFSLIRRVWLDHGGILVIANVRGGGEFGDAWHLAGNLTHKQNVFDDFIGAAQHLIARGYTSPARLAAQGGSNGGLLMGAALTQRPDLFRAVHSAVGIYDMLRIELDPNGAFNVTEFGTVKDPAQFAALYGYSPFHHVKDGTAYPAILMTTGDNDGRVNPAQSRKMIARLQAANPAGQPILLRTNAASGHGIGTALSEVIDERTDIYTFLLQQLGVNLTQALQTASH